MISHGSPCYQLQAPYSKATHGAPYPFHLLTYPYILLHIDGPHDKMQDALAQNLTLIAFSHSDWYTEHDMNVMDVMKWENVHYTPMDTNSLMGHHCCVKRSIKTHHRRSLKATELGG